MRLSERIKRMVMQFIRFVKLLLAAARTFRRDGFLQFMIERLLASSAPAEIVEDEMRNRTDEAIIQSITDAIQNCRTISVWARKSLQLPVPTITEEESHAQRALPL